MTAQTREIYTYTDLRTLGQAPFWNQIRNCPQVTVSADLRKSLKGTRQYDRVNGIFKDDPQVHAAEFHRLSDLAFPGWNAEETRFHESVLLAQFIRRQIHEKGDDPDLRHWLVGCRRNIGPLLSSILLLEESGLRPEMSGWNGSRNLKMLSAAWRFLETHDPAIAAFRARQKELERQDAWDPVLNRLFGVSTVSAIIFHGFYGFTPIQEQVIRLLEISGYELKFLFPYDSRYPYANEIWKRTYARQNGYPPEYEWHCQIPDRPEAAGEILEGRACPFSNQVSIREYASVMEFVRDMKRVRDQGFFLYSAAAGTANEILRDFYPEEYGDRKLLSYPVGQFVSLLNQMWDENRQEILLDEDCLMECFASGWLTVDGEAARQYMKDLADLMPYFRGCRRPDAWRARMKLLQEAYDGAVWPFEKQWDSDPRTARWQEIMGNPLLNFSVFAVRKERMEAVLKLIRQVLSMAEELFEDGSTILTRDYIRKLDRILRQYQVSGELYEEERELVGELFEKLDDPSGFSETCSPSDAADALSLYLSGQLQDGELRTDRIGMVSPLYQVDAAPVKQHGKIHVCLCDSANLPGGKKKYPWPLSERTVKEWLEQSGSRMLKCFVQGMEDTGIRARYFIYSALKNTEVQLSWVRKMGGRPYAPSPYLCLIGEAGGVPTIRTGQSTVTEQRVRRMPEGESRTLPYDRADMPIETAKEAGMDYAICPIRYALGYLADRFPSFSTEFHQNYAVNGLIAALDGVFREQGITGISADEIYQQTVELFPAMRNVEKRQVYDYLRGENSFHDSREAGVSVLGTMAFSGDRLKVRFPNQQVWEMALTEYGRLQTPDGRNGLDFGYPNMRTAEQDGRRQEKKMSVSACLFCPQQNCCKYAVFQADQEALYD